MASAPYVVLCCNTAALFWRAVREGRLAPPSPCELPHPFRGISGYRELRAIDFGPLGLTLTDQGVCARYSPQWVEVMEGKASHPQLVFRPQGFGLAPGKFLPLDILVDTRGRCRKSRAIHPHYSSASVPTDSFSQISEHVLVTSPPLTFVQTCLRNRMLPNIEWGMECCGSYALHAPSTARVSSAAPLFSARDLEAYIGALNPCRGIEAAREACGWIVDGMASPRETELYLMLVLPPQLGGFGLPRPQVNKVIALRGTVAERLTNEPFFIADLIYELDRSEIKGIIVEYDGSDDHEVLPKDVLHDKERRSVLAALGYIVIVVTRQDLQEVARLRRKVEQIARALGETLPTHTVTQSRACETLSSWLFDPLHDHLPLGYGYS